MLKVNTFFCYRYVAYQPIWRLLGSKYHIIAETEEGVGLRLRVATGWISVEFRFIQVL